MLYRIISFPFVSLVRIPSSRSGKNIYIAQSINNVQKFCKRFIRHLCASGSYLPLEMFEAEIEVERIHLTSCEEERKNCLFIQCNHKSGEDVCGSVESCSWKPVH